MRRVLTALVLLPAVISLVLWGNPWLFAGVLALAMNPE